RQEKVEYASTGASVRAREEEANEVGVPRACLVQRRGLTQERPGLGEWDKELRDTRGYLLALPVGVCRVLSVPARLAFPARNGILMRRRRFIRPRMWCNL